MSSHIDLSLKRWANIVDAYPSIQKKIDLQRQSKDFRYPSWCFLPIQSWKKALESKERDASLGALLCNATILTWGYTKGIYEFSSDLISHLQNTDINNIPLEVLFRLPEWSIFVTTKNKKSEVFFASLQYNPETDEKYIVIAQNEDKEATVIPMSYKICGDYLLANENNDIRTCLTRLLYICSDNPDIQAINNRLPERAKPKKTQFGWRMFFAETSSSWLIGYNLKPRQNKTATWNGKISMVKNRHGVQKERFSFDLEII